MFNGISRKPALAAGISGVLVAATIFLAAQERPKPGEILKHAKLEVVLPDFPAKGLIMDVGGGGEGVIGQLKGKQVVARKDEAGWFFLELKKPA